MRNTHLAMRGQSCPRSPSPVDHILL